MKETCGVIWSFIYWIKPRRVVALVQTKGKVDNKTFSSILGVKMRTIQRTRKTLEESKDPRGVIKRSPKSLEHNRKLRNADFVKKVETMINNKPSQPMRSMAAEPKVDKQTIQRCVEDLYCKSYRMQTSQILAQAAKDQRMLKSSKLLNKLKHPKKPNATCCGSSLIK